MSTDIKIYGVAFLKADNRGYADDFKTFAAEDHLEAVQICRDMFNPIAITAVYLEIASYERDLE